MALFLAALQLLFLPSNSRRRSVSRTDRALRPVGSMPPQKHKFKGLIEQASLGNVLSDTDEAELDEDANNNNDDQLKCE